MGERTTREWANRGFVFISFNPLSTESKHDSEEFVDMIHRIDSGQNGVRAVPVGSLKIELWRSNAMIIGMEDRDKWIERNERCYAR